MQAAGRCAAGADTDEALYAPAQTKDGKAPGESSVLAAASEWACVGSRRYFTQRREGAW